MKKNRLQQNTFTHPKFSELEEQVLAYWDEVNAFQKSVESRPESKPYVFYDGPPFATGLPHYGHLLGSTMKDIVPRYWTMKGYRVERVWGWDCHGIPIENMIEKELGLKGGKKGIEAMGIDKFNAACRAAILRFDTEWEKIIRRIGRWVDMKHSYKTMDKTFMESVWWAFKSLYDKGLAYQGRKVILYCPRCSSPLSNFEIAMDNSYKDVEDYSVLVKFKLKNTQNEYILAWTTTPWTLIGNVGLAVDPKALYLKVSQNGDILYLAKARQDILKSDYEILETVKGETLINQDYEPLFSYVPFQKKAHFVMSADFVSLEEGSGIVHTAAMYGEDDYKLALANDLPLVDMLDDQGKFLEFVEPLAGVFYKKAEDWIVKDLTDRNLLYKAEKFTHSYPFCYRCETPLYYNAIPAWFINIQKLKPELVKQNESINWFPAHLKHGRFGKGLQTAPDWNISRSRYWGTPMPVWQNKDHYRIIGSIDELKKWAVHPELVEKLTDIHREYLDDLEVWVDDQKTVKGKRIKEVFDCWIESGSMPFASEHFPFESEARFKARHPAQYIVEYIAQTRAWFYTLHVMSVALFGSHTFENALTTGTIMASDGTKMSKSKKNYTDPMLLVDKYGVDSLRLYFASSPLMKTAENVNFNETAVDDIRKKVFNIFWNVFTFYKLYDDGTDNFHLPEKIDHVLDRWLVSRTEQLNLTVTKAMDAYDVVTASRSLMSFVDELSTWWLRLSRDRLRDKQTNSQALVVFRNVLLKWSLLMAPFAPFFTEVIYQNLLAKPQDSIHLELLPKIDAKKIDETLEEKMELTQKIVEGLHAIRKEKGVRTRQPLGEWGFNGRDSNALVGYGLVELIEQEVNVKQIIPADERQEKWFKKPTVQFINVTTKKWGNIDVFLDTSLTPALKAEGEARELIRQIQQARKDAGVALNELVTVTLPDWPKDYETDIKTKVLAKSLIKGKELKVTT